MVLNVTNTHTYRHRSKINTEIMFVNYSSLGKTKLTNKLFAEKYLELLFFESLNLNDKLVFIKGKYENNELIQKFKIEDLNGNDNWLEYVMILCLSKEQMEKSMEELIIDKTLLAVDFSIQNCSFENCLELDESNVIRKLIIDVYIENVFLKCRVNSYLKEYTKLLVSSKKILRETPNKETLFPEYFLNEINEEVVDIYLPVNFPQSYCNLLKKDGSVNALVTVDFLKWELKDKKRIFSDELTMDDIIARNKIVHTNWKVNNNTFGVYNKENISEYSETSIILKQIHDRHIERKEFIQSITNTLTNRKIVENTLEIPKFIDVFDDNTMSFIHNCENWVESSTNRIEMIYTPENGVLKDFKSMESPVLAENNINNNKNISIKPVPKKVEKDDGIEHIRLETCVNTQNNLTDLDLAINQSNILYMPNLNDVDVPDLNLKLSNKHHLSRMAHKLKKVFIYPFIKDNQDYDLEGSYSTDYAVFSTISIRRFLKSKVFKIKQEYKYYSQVAKYCLEDFKDISSRRIIDREF